jgi:hypothetical protein
MQLVNEDKIDVHQQTCFAQNCYWCKQSLEISEGDVLYGTQWYHKSCWDAVEKEQNSRPAETNLISFANYA